MFMSDDKRTLLREAVTEAKAEYEALPRWRFIKRHRAKEIWLALRKARAFFILAE